MIQVPRQKISNIPMIQNIHLNSEGFKIHQKK